MRRVISIVLVLSTILIACDRSKPLSPIAYVQFMDQSTDYKRNVDAGKTTYTVQLATPEYMAIKEVFDPRAPLNAAKLNERIGELKGYVFFLINITKKDAEDSKLKTALTEQSVNQNLVMYYEGAANDITLNDGTTEIKPATYHFENNYGLSPYNTIVVAFKVMESDHKEMQLVFNDKYADNSFIKAGFSKRTITDPPTLLINSN